MKSSHGATDSGQRARAPLAAPLERKENVELEVEMVDTVADDGAKARLQQSLSEELSMNTHTTAPAGSAVRDLPGGIRKNVTQVDKDHPLSELDPTLEVLLSNQGPQILKRYQRAKHHQAHVTKFEPLAFTTQVVAGINYYVKLRPIAGIAHAAAGDHDIVHVRIFYQAWTQTTELTGFVAGKKLSDPLDHDYPPLDPLTADSTGSNLEKRDQHQLAKEAMADVPPITMIRK
ncbi:cystatin-A/B [Entomortierella parvispora]|uniref:Cystatin-A/B n=1 Tax=Entomortierella parvispora TaxID=205924 RepID=A0A9P3LU99_9FUNG|nr:cystatin-A/B [Entomortierella parvispora]